MSRRYDIRPQHCGALAPRGPKSRPQSPLQRKHSAVFVPQRIGQTAQDERHLTENRIKIRQPRPDVEAAGGRPSGRRPRRAVCTGTGFIGPGAPLYGRAGREHGTEGEGREPSLPEREQRPSPMGLHEQAGPQFGERKIVGHLPVGCHGVEFPPHGNHVRKPSATPFGPTVVAAVENERRRQPAQGLPDRTLDASRNRIAISS